MFCTLELLTFQTEHSTFLLEKLAPIFLENLSVVFLLLYWICIAIIIIASVYLVVLIFINMCSCFSPVTGRYLTTLGSAPPVPDDDDGGY
jgi:hypothetical protein